MNIAAPTFQMRFGAAVLTLRKPTPIKAFPYFHSVSLKIRCKIRKSLFRSSLNSIRQKQKNAAPPFPVRHRLCTLFHHFSFLPPLFVLAFTAPVVFKFPNQFFIFSVRGCASLCGDAIKPINSALAQYCIVPSLMPVKASSRIHSCMRCGL